MAMPLFQIPGNVKQQFLPFVLNPESLLNSGVGVGSSAFFEKNATSPQFFTYCEKRKPNNVSSGAVCLNYYPSSFKSNLFDEDVSNKVLYEYKSDAGRSPKESVKLDDILTHIPAIQIREFLPDTRLDQCINFFTDLFSSMTNMIEKKNSDNSGTSKSKSPTGIGDKIKWYIDKFLACAEFVIKYMTGMSKNNFYTDMKLSNNIDFPFSNYNPSMWKDAQHLGVPAHSPGFYVMQFPFTLYYRLQSCITSNIYEVPAISDAKRVISSEGMEGWTSKGSDLMSAGGVKLSKITGKLGQVLGNVTQMLLGNIGVDYLPWWDAENGSKTKEPQIDLKFDLFNDTKEAALINFIFINTIVPNNKWIQYNMFQHSSCLYDVKIEGLNRLYACAGSFNVTYDGVLRDPSQEFINDLVTKYANHNIIRANMIEGIKKNKLIKIPDVYHVEMHFQSLLPANFNNFIFSYAENANHITKYHNNVYDPTLGAVFGKALGKFGQRITKVWDEGKADAHENMVIVEKTNDQQQQEKKDADAKQLKRLQEQAKRDREDAEKAAAEKIKMTTKTKTVVDRNYEDN